MSSNQNNVLNYESCNQLSTNTSLTNPSICIPRVFTNISINEITNVFQNKLKIGPIKKVDVIYNNNNSNYHTINNNQMVDTHKKYSSQHTPNNIVPEHNFKKVFVHFKYWNDGNDNLKTTLNEGKIIKVVYDNPWFWKCSLTKSK